MKVKVKVKSITEHEVIEIMENHGWNYYGIESMADEIHDHLPMTKREFLAYLADYED